MNNRLGCLTGAGIFAMLITALAIAGVAFAQGNMMFSAGPLNSQSKGHLVGNVASHADISAQCEYCHTAPWDSITMADRCMACHTDIAAQLPDVTKLHGVMLQFNKSLTCRNCHPEHRGAAASLTMMDSSLFPHNAEGFSLNGHQQNVNGEAFTCGACHSTDISKFDPAVCQTCHNQIDTAFMQTHIQAYGAICLNCHDGVDRFGRKNFDHSKFAFQLIGKHAAVDCAKCHAGAQTLQTFSSAPTDCFSCHQKDDPHAGRFGTNCGSCHTPDGWKPANFNHDLAAFKLTGLHVQVQCEKCHVNGVLNGAPTDCFSCHQKDDKHGGQFGADCATCHTTDGWDKANVDHSKFAFPLVGKHLTVACEQCHANAVFKGTPKDCYSCHKQNDPHNGQLGTDCGSCHIPDGWKPARFDHNLAAFKLTGQHVNVACTQCHVNDLFKSTPTDCVACHKKDDQHNGQFGTSCGTCHNTNSWKDVTFDHNLAAFKLTGAHVNVACASCHVNGVFKGTPQDCYSCHKQNDHHNGQFGTNCGACHDTSSWANATFDHNLAAFKLTGAHVNVACSSCHVNGVFKGTPKDCYSCHKQNDHHNSQLGANCGACHSTSAWKPASFDHNLAAFKLTGVHVNVACSSCHINGVFKGTPQDCYSCHKQNDHHNGSFGTNCGSCHSTSTWSGATFNHNTTGFPLTGGHANLNCTRCHQSGQFQGLSTACFSCHADPAFHAGAFGLNCAQCHNTSSWSSARFSGSHPSPGVNHGGASCRTCHPSTVFSATCLACHDSNNPGDGGGGDGGGGGD